MITVVPRARTEPTEGKVPERIFQNSACCPGSWVNWAGSSRVSAAQASRARRSRSWRMDSSVPWNSASRAAAPSGRSLMFGGMPGWSWTERREARSSISRAAAPASRSGTMAAQAACRSGNSRKPVTFTGRSGTVRSTAWAMKARVPSEPTSRLRKMSTGRS